MLNKLSIAKRLAFGFGLVLALLLVVAGSGYWGMESITQETVQMLHHDAKLTLLADDATEYALDLRRYEKDFFPISMTQKHEAIIFRNGRMKLQL